MLEFDLGEKKRCVKVVLFTDDCGPVWFINGACEAPECWFNICLKKLSTSSFAGQNVSSIAVEWDQLSDIGPEAEESEDVWCSK